jgi:hypothetical protein
MFYIYTAFVGISLTMYASNCAQGALLMMRGNIGQSDYSEQYCAMPEVLAGMVGIFHGIFFCAGLAMAVLFYFAEQIQAVQAAQRNCNFQSVKVETPNDLRLRAMPTPALRHSLLSHAV